MVPNGKKIAAFCVLLFIRIFKAVFQMPDGCCRFSPTCSEYAREAMEKHHFPAALYMIFKRLMSCHPFNKGGFDPVPKKP